MLFKDFANVVTKLPCHVSFHIIIKTIKGEAIGNELVTGLPRYIECPQQRGAEVKNLSVPLQTSNRRTHVLNLRRSVHISTVGNFTWVPQQL